MPLTLQDLIALTRYCAGFGPDERATKCREVLKRVNEAACFNGITGKVHPFYGDGSITSLLMRYSLGQIPSSLDYKMLTVLLTVVLTLFEASEEKL
jgi:hypothetical protein